MYYKVKKDSSIVDILEEIIYVKWQKSNDLIVYNYTPKGSFGIISSNGDIFKLKELKGECHYDFDFVELIEITEEEYNSLRAILDENQSVVEDEPEDPEIPFVSKGTLDFAITNKVSSMNKACNLAITDGFDIVLSDGILYHFDLTTEDQINLILLGELVASGEKNIPYHASGELCKFYSATDISAIIAKASEHKTYHISYFNSLREYIYSLTSLEDIAGISYGCEIPEEYQSEVLKSLLGGNSNE